MHLLSLTVAGLVGSAAMSSLKVVSLNVNGLNVPSKRRIIFDYLRRSDAGVCLLQETHATLSSAPLWRTEWGGQAFFNNGTRSSRGVAILVSKKFSPNILHITSDDEGRILLMDLEVSDTVYTVGSYYAPTQDKPQCQMETLQVLENLLSELTAEQIIIGGDLNCFLDPSTDRNSRTPCSNQSESVRDRINLLREDWGLCDLWRVRNPSQRGYTFRRGTYASRLDYFLVSNHISELVSSCKVTSLVHSDHAMISMVVQTSKIKRGPGLWRFDAHLVQDDHFNRKMSAFLQNWQPPTELHDPASVWEWMKYEIKNFVSDYTKRIHCREKQQIAELSQQLSDLNAKMDEEGTDLTLEANSITRELKEIEESKARRMMFRARCNWALQGERCSKYFLNLEKRRSQERTLSSLTSSNGELTTDPSKILEIGRSFYADLYKHQEDQLAPIDEIEDEIAKLDIPRLSSEDRDSLDAPLSEEELRNVLSHMNHGKSPGSDGLPPEFYQKFWAHLAPYFCASLQHAISTGQLTSGQTRGIITLIPKKDVDRTKIQNWRPITLLNTDYKIFTKALSLRFKGVMGLLVHPNQTGFMSGRYIGDSVRIVEDCLEVIKERHEEGMVVALDFAKAFDSVRWSLVITTLKALNFGDEFIEYVKLLFQNVETCVMNYGSTSKSFAPQRGLRQGCCASPHIFLLVAEILAHLIRHNSSIKGIRLGRSEMKIAQFADDLTCMLSDESSLRELMNVLKKFETWSGLRINKSKTKIISPGRLAGGCSDLEGMEVSSRAKILGIWIGTENTEENCYQWNFKKPLEKYNRFVTLGTTVTFL